MLGISAHVGRPRVRSEHPSDVRYSRSDIPRTFERTWPPNQPFDRVHIPSDRRSFAGVTRTANERAHSVRSKVFFSVSFLKQDRFSSISIKNDHRKQKTFLEKSFSTKNEVGIFHIRPKAICIRFCNFFNSIKSYLHKIL